MMMAKRAWVVVFVLALGWGALLALVIRQPGYTDAYYYFNAGQRLAQGHGLTDANLWVYMNAPAHLPGPSHTYWMPLESLVAALFMRAAGTNFGVAQIPSVLCFAGLVVVAFQLGAVQGGNRRHAWAAALLVLFSGFFTPFWTTTDTFALFGLMGALALIAAGRARETGALRWCAAGGALSGLAHLARADGVLLLAVLVLLVAWPRVGRSGPQRGRGAAIALLAYLLVMAPWFARNWSVLGTPLPSGGLQTIWLRGYNELVNYPPGTSLAAFLDWGMGPILRSRWDALQTNLGTFVAVETWVILGPFVLLGLWSGRRAPLWQAVMLYALGLHLAMTFVFAYPGQRGGLFHSSAALLPFWAAAGLRGLDAAVRWAAQRRRWRMAQAQRVFTTALIVLAAAISVGMLAARAGRWNDNATFYTALARDLPPGAGLMVNDPPALYYHTGRSGIVVPNADPDVVPALAARYGVRYLVLDANRTEPFAALFLGRETRPYLRLVRVEDGGTPDPADDRRVFEILPVEQDP